MPKIVIASGYFDPLHIGHINYLKAARKLGDELIVIVNNDAQAVEKKGVVFMSASERLILIKSLRYVDKVMISLDWDLSVNKSLEFLVERYQTNRGRKCDDIIKEKNFIFAKGGDRNKNNIPEKDICNKLGIKIIDGVGGKKIQSSSKLLAKIK